MIKPIFDIKFVAIVLLLLIGVTAITAGWILNSNSSGQELQIPIFILDHSIFNNYLIPAVLLSTFIGFLSVVIIVFTFIETRSYPYLIILGIYFLIIGLCFYLIIKFDFFSSIFHFFLIDFGLILLIFGYFESKLKTT